MTPSQPPILPTLATSEKVVAASQQPSWISRSGCKVVIICYLAAVIGLFMAWIVIAAISYQAKPDHNQENALHFGNTTSNDEPVIWRFRKYHIQIINSLVGGNNLTLECKSYDDRIGIHILEPGQVFEFSSHFGLNPLKTVFKCDFGWQDGYLRDQRVFWYWKALIQRCGFKTCSWSAKNDGLYIRNVPNDTYEFVKKWD